MSDETWVPKEQMTAYQRWELPSFDAKPPPPPPQETVPEQALPTVIQMEQWHQQAQQEGYEAGYAAGVQQGVQDSQQIGQIMTQLQIQISQLDQQLLQSLMDLALELAHQVVRQALQVKPELVLAVVQEAVASLPHFNQTAHLFLHPEDAPLVRRALEDTLGHSGWKILEDSRLARGGCRVETAHSQIDASVGKRWQQVVASIGQTAEWLQR